MCPRNCLHAFCFILNAECSEILCFTRHSAIKLLYFTFHPLERIDCRFAFLHFLVSNNTYKGTRLGLELSTAFPYVAGIFTKESQVTSFTLQLHEKKQKRTERPLELIFSSFFFTMHRIVCEKENVNIPFSKVGTILHTQACSLKIIKQIH